MKTVSAAVILYGPPASGKDTVTAALTEFDPNAQLFRRLKIGSGRTTGYRTGDSALLARLEAAGEVLYANHRYNATYIIDKPELEAMLAAGTIPVVHVGQPEAINTLRRTMPQLRWLVVELWCPRATAAERIERRKTGDTAARLAVWDSTPHLTEADLRIDTGELSAIDAADRIHRALRLHTWTAVVPVMHLVAPSGRVDFEATRRYAALCSAGWIDRFLVNGSTTSADRLTAAERAALLDIWIDAVGRDRLLACSWNSDDLAVAADRSVTPMAVMRCDSEDQARGWLSGLPSGATIYSHPMYGSVFESGLAMWAAEKGCLPAAGKLAKVGLGELDALRQKVPEFHAWDGSSRRIQQSLAAGASGVVATPLAALILDLPDRFLPDLQHAIDDIQSTLDQLPDREARRDFIRGAVQQGLLKHSIDN